MTGNVSGSLEPCAAKGGTHGSEGGRLVAIQACLPDLDLGGQVKKGEKSTPVIYYKLFEKQDEAGNVVVRKDGSPYRIPFVRWSNVFNLDQTEGITPPAITATQSVTQPREKAAAIVEHAKLCPIHHAGFAACYLPKDDVIRVPAPSTFYSQRLIITPSITK